MSCAFGVLGKIDDSGCYALRVDYELDINRERRRKVIEEVCCLYKCILIFFINLFTDSSFPLLLC